MTRALALGGGGPVRIAWEPEVAAGLAEAGVEIAEADRIIGASAGAFIGAQLAGGRSPAPLAQAQIALGEREAQAKAEGRPGAGGGFTPDLQPLLALMMRPMAEGETPEQRRMEFGKLALNTRTMPEQEFMAAFGSLSEGEHPWPRRFACTAVNALSGGFVVCTSRPRPSSARWCSTACSSGTAS